VRILGRNGQISTSFSLVTAVVLQIAPYSFMLNLSNIGFNQNTLLKKTQKGREEEEEEVSSYWMTLKKREDTVI
jgi:hypothetical protein